LRVPFADVGPIKIPSGLTDDQVLFLSDIFPTGYMAADFCDLKGGETVAIWGCGPVGQFAIKSAFLLGAERVIAIDTVPERLALAAASGAIILDFISRAARAGSRTIQDFPRQEGRLHQGRLEAVTLWRGS
jgi:threonine dehydrogenase-like Zn-dependent dehydrogenase